MIVHVDAEKVTLELDATPILSGEKNVHECDFEFSSEYDNLIKVCIFTKFGRVYRRNIIDNKCEIPQQVLALDGNVLLGVYGYNIVDNEMNIVYSPKPSMFRIDKGSYMHYRCSDLDPDEYEELLFIIAKLSEEERKDINAILVNGTEVQKVNKSVDIFVPTDLSQLSNNITKFVNENQLNTAISSLGNVLSYKGTVNTIADLPSSQNKVGDVYYVKANSSEYVWSDKDGVQSWEELGPIVDLSAYYTKTEANEKFVDASGDTMTGDLNISDGNVDRVKLRKDGSVHIYDSTGTSESIINNNADGQTYISNFKDGSVTLSGPKANLTLSGGEAKIARQGGTASGNASTAVGGGATASGEYSTAIGPGATASGNQSIALGSGSQASGFQSVAIGGGAMAKGYQSVAIGGGANVEGSGSMSLGPNAVKGGNSFVSGAGNTSESSANYFIACGTANNIKGYGTLTAGENNYNSGRNSTATGITNFTGGIATQANGSHSVASGNYSHAEGVGSPLTNVGTVTVLTSSVERLNGDYYTLITFNPGGLYLYRR